MTTVVPGKYESLAPNSHVAYAASALAIVTSCVLAASVPALRAARIDPVRENLLWQADFVADAS